MDNSVIQKIQDVLDKNEMFGIAVSKNPNLDEMGAALSLYLSLKADGKNLSIACPTEPLVENSSLVGIDKVKTSFSSDKGDLIVSFPYAEGDIEKVSYTLEDGYLNIIVKGGRDGLSFSEKDVQYKRGNAAPDAIFVVGTARISDLGDLYNTENLKNTTVINIDNKNDNQGFGDIVIVDRNASSVSETLGMILTSLGLPIDIDIAQNLLLGISFSTDNFGHPKTSATAFEMAANLLRKGAVRQKQAISPFTMPKVQPRGAFGQQRDSRSFRPKTTSPFFQKAATAQPSSYQGDTTTFSSKNVPPPPMIERKDIKKEEDSGETPPDWLTPKVYKGSTLV